MHYKRINAQKISWTMRVTKSTWASLGVAASGSFDAMSSDGAGSGAVRYRRLGTSDTVDEVKLTSNSGYGISALGALTVESQSGSQAGGVTTLSFTTNAAGIGERTLTHTLGQKNLMIWAHGSTYVFVNIAMWQLLARSNLILSHLIAEQQLLRLPFGQGQARR